MKSRFWSSDWLAGPPITILIVLLAGSLPFKVDLMPGLMLKITNDEAAATRTIRADILLTLAAGITRASLTNPKLRYQGDFELADALKIFLKA